ncbi:MAG: glycosyltransferase [Cytophagales bacterium]|nr:glycosyltransferase [Cytophagales bacterium]
MKVKPKYSIIIPVYNRPQEVDELLESLTKQTFQDFEVLIIEDGSSLSCEDVVEGYQGKLAVKYFFKENSGQGFSRNYGFERVKGDWFLVFDSDCLIPEDYLQLVDEHLKVNELDAYGGPDRAAESFTSVQKAISYSMTSFLTTGGIRGGKTKMGSFHPRSFNMGIKREVFEKTGGYKITRKGEDIEFSIRISENGFKVGLIPEAFVYHKRRTNFIQFFKQLHFFGTARINIGRFYPKEIKAVHLFPVIFLIGFGFSLFGTLFGLKIGLIGLRLFLLYFLAIWISATGRTENFLVGLLSIVASFIQLAAYGLGFIQEKLTSPPDK